MKKQGLFAQIMGVCLLATLLSCGGNAVSEEPVVAKNVQKEGEQAPKLKEIRRIAQDPSWGEDVMIQDVLLGTPQRYYLGDHRAIRILAVDKNGKLLHSFLKKGQGPGEFQWLRMIQKPGNTLWVSGGRKLDSFSMDGILKSETHLGHYYYNLKMMDDSRFVGVRIETEGVAINGPRLKRAGLWDLKEKTLKSFRTSDKIGVFEFKNDKMYLTISFGGIVMPDLILAADPAKKRIYICETDIYRIYVLNMEGKLIQTIERTVEPAVLTDKGKDEMAGSFRMSGMDQNDVRRRLKRQLPDRMCQVASLQVTPDGYLIVEHPVKYDTSELDMFSPTGEFLATLQNPKDIDFSRATFLSHDRFALVNDKGDSPVVTEYRWIQPERK